MLDLTEQELSDAIHQIGKEINRGCWLLDREGVPTFLPLEVTIQAKVTVASGLVNVESISAQAVGAQTTTDTQTSDSTRADNTFNRQGGDDTDTTTYDYN